MYSADDFFFYGPSMRPDNNCWVKNIIFQFFEKRNANIKILESFRKK